MLQINTGKLFKSGIRSINNLEAVLYSNAFMVGGTKLSTLGGTLQKDDQCDFPYCYIFKIREKIGNEDPVGLISSGVQPYVEEFALLASFGLNAIFSTNISTLNNLIKYNSRSLYFHQNMLVQHFFDDRVVISEQIIREFKSLVNKFLNLDRKIYLKAKQSIRTYVTAIENIPSDPALAYTLLVSAIEILADDFKNFTVTWDNMKEPKRQKFDSVLKDMEKTKIQEIQEAILSFERKSLAYKYTNFITKLLGKNYFLEENTTNINPIRKKDLPKLLHNAYDLRSKYVHSAKQLPPPVTIPFNYQEVVNDPIERQIYLSLQGLIKITKYSIQKYIRVGPKLKKETNYTWQRHGIENLPIAPQYYIWRDLTDSGQALIRLEGLLSVISSKMMGDNKVVIPNLIHTLIDVERLFEQSKEIDKVRMFSLYLLYSEFGPIEFQSVNCDTFLNKNCKMINFQYVENLITKVLIPDLPEWDIDIHEKIYLSYWQKRHFKDEIKTTYLIEAAMALDLAERFRSTGKLSQAIKYLNEAVESFPHHPNLREFLKIFDEKMPIVWRNILTK